MRRTGGPKTPEGRARALANLLQYRHRSSVSGPETELQSQPIDPADLIGPHPEAVPAISTDKGTAMTPTTLEHQAATPETSDQLRRRLAALGGQLAAAQNDLEAANARLGDAALDENDVQTSRAADAVSQHQQALQRLEATRAALERRLAAAVQREALDEHGRRWADYADALAARHAAFEHAEALSKPFFAAVKAAVAASQRAWALSPVKGDILTPGGWELVLHVFEGVAKLKDEELVTVELALRDMTAKSRADAERMHRLRAFTEPGKQSAANIADVA